jgi:hypothetical protein
MTDANTLLIEIPSADQQVVADLQGDDDVDVFTTRRFEGAPDLIQVIVPAVVALLPLAVKVIIEQIRARRYVRVKVRGIEITGMTEGNVARLINVAMKREVTTEPKQRRTTSKKTSKRKR